MFAHSCNYAAIHNIKYDLKLNVVEGEKFTKNRDQNKALELWKKKVVDELEHFPPCVPNDYFGYTKQKKWFQQVEKKVLDFGIINRLKYSLSEHSLKDLIPRIGNQVLKLFSIFYQIKIDMKTEMLKMYSQRVIFTKHFTIDYMKSVKEIMKDGKITVRDMLAVCSYFCLEDKINDIPEGLIEKVVDENDKSEISQLMLLWIFRVKNKKREFDHVVGELKQKLYASTTEKDGEFLLFWAIKKENEAAVQFLWENLCDEETKENPQKFATRALHYHNINIVCYLASQMTRIDQINFFYVNHGYVLLSMLASNSRWNGYFIPTSEYILQFTSKMTFICNLKTLFCCWIVNKFNSNNYVKHFDAFIAKFNVNMNKSILDSTTSILNVICELEERDIINQLLCVKNDDDIKRIFNHNALINELGKELVFKRKSQLFDKFIKEIFAEKEITKFKIRFFEKTIFEICLKCFEENKYEALNEFVTTFQFESSLDIKENILFEEKGKIIGRALLLGDESRIDKMDKMLGWCYDGNENLILNCKKRLFNPDDDYYYCAKVHFLTVVKTFIDKNKWDEVVTLLKWAFPKDPSLEYKTIIFAINLTIKN